MLVQIQVFRLYTQYRSLVIHMEGREGQNIEPMTTFQPNPLVSLQRLSASYFPTHYRCLIQPMMLSKELWWVKVVIATILSDGQTCVCFCPPRVCSVYDALTTTFTFYPWQTYVCQLCGPLWLKSVVPCVHIVMCVNEQPISNVFYCAPHDYSDFKQDKFP